LAFGGTASLLVFIGLAIAVLVTGGWRNGVARNSTIGACALLCLLTLAAAATISLHTPILTSRNMIVVLPAIYVIAAELTSCLIRRSRRPGPKVRRLFPGGRWIRTCGPAQKTSISSHGTGAAAGVQTIGPQYGDRITLAAVLEGGYRACVLLASFI